MIALVLPALAAELPVCDAYDQASAPIVVEGTPEIQSSGIAAARSHPGRFFTHDDAGGSALLHIFERDGDGARYVGAQTVQGAQNVDWEDIATGPCPKGVDAEWCLWIGDIGDNEKGRASIDVWVVPDTMEAGAPAARCTFVYAEGKRYDAEALFVSPDRTLRIVTKEGDGEAKVYRIDDPKCDGGDAQTLVREAEFSPGEKITGGTMNDEGTAVVLRSLTRAWLWTGCDIDWTAPAVEIDLGEQPQGEAVAFLADGSLVSTSEGEPLQMWETACLETTTIECVDECGCAAPPTRSAAAVPLAIALAAAFARNRRRAP